MFAINKKIQIGISNSALNEIWQIYKSCKKKLIQFADRFIIKLLAKLL